MGFMGYYLLGKVELYTSKKFIKNLTAKNYPAFLLKERRGNSKISRMFF